MLTSQQLGKNTGLSVSKLCLGTMNFGEPGRGHQGDWTLGVDDARPIFQAAIEHGVNYFDCADIYGVGASEIVVGQLLKELLPRDEYALTTKVSMPMGRAPNQGGLSRKHIMEGVDQSLKRLGHDYVDQLIIHRHPHGIPGLAQTPIEETMEALNDVVKAGKALYLGASSMFAWQFAELQMTAAQNGWTKFISMQNHLNLIYREEEREMIPYCIKTGVAITPWSPLARGILAGAYQGGFDKGSTTDHPAKTESALNRCIRARTSLRSRIALSRLPKNTVKPQPRSLLLGCLPLRVLFARLSAYRKPPSLQIWLRRPPLNSQRMMSPILRPCISQLRICCRRECLRRPPNATL